MVFDKTKAMRNAERHVAQGKIQSAIGEYKQVVANDPKDIGTLNMLGDLYAKTADKKQAVVCYTAVAEHYSMQGFAQKAIAIYNKILKIQPGLAGISEKLADLYRSKGSTNEARSHYNIVAADYETQGRKIEALEVRKQIASLDPADTAIQLALAAAYVRENQTDEASDAFAEASARFTKKSNHPEAIGALEKAMELTPTNAKVLAAFVQSHFALGTAPDAARRLSEIHTSEPHDRDVAHLLIDCYLEARDKVEAEKAIITLVEKEPSDYPKLVALARLYLNDGEAGPAGRVMAMLSEHLLSAGQADEFQALLSEILALDPAQLEGLRLRARLAVWQRDESAMHDALAELAAVAKKLESIDDERFALSQLVMIAPNEIEFAQRLKEINGEFGFEDAYESPESLFDAQFLKPRSESELESVARKADDDAGSVPDDGAGFGDFAIVGAPSGNGNGIIHADAQLDTSKTVDADAGSESDDDRLIRESDSIRFYIDSGYLDLAEEAIRELRQEFGDRAEIDALVQQLEQQGGGQMQQPGEIEIPAPRPAAVDETKLTTSSPSLNIEDFRSELGLDEPDSADDSDYETHYHTAVAYQEMGLLDEAVREFQEAVGLVAADDSSRRFLQCANLLGHCFMQKSMPHLALTWYQRALETPGLTDEEKQGIWYELALAHEAEGDLDNAGRYFEQVYAENIDFRDVSERMKNIAVRR